MPRPTKVVPGEVEKYVLDNLKQWKSEHRHRFNSYARKQIEEKFNFVLSRNDVLRIVNERTDNAADVEHSNDERQTQTIDENEGKADSFCCFYCISSIGFEHFVIDNMTFAAQNEQKSKTKLIKRSWMSKSCKLHQMN